jgi:hypothetical protein
MKGFERYLPVTYHGRWSHTEWAPLEEFPYSANAGHSGQDHNGQPDEADQAANVKNLGYCAELSPFGDHRDTTKSFSKFLLSDLLDCLPLLSSISIWPVRRQESPVSSLVQVGSAILPTP